MSRIPLVVCVIRFYGTSEVEEAWACALHVRHSCENVPPRLTSAGSSLLPGRRPVGKAAICPTVLLERWSVQAQLVGPGGGRREGLSRPLSSTVTLGTRPPNASLKSQPYLACRLRPCSVRVCSGACKPGNSAPAQPQGKDFPGLWRSFLRRIRSSKSPWGTEQGG